MGVTALTAVTIFTSHTLAAATSNQTLNERLAEKLNLDRVKVDSALNSIEEENFANRQAEGKTKLDQAVKDGVITADQEQKIIDRKKELHNERQKQRMELKQWISDNNIDTTKLREYGIGIDFGRFGERGRYTNGGGGGEIHG